MHDKGDNVSAGRPDWHAYLRGQLRDVGVPEVRLFRWWEGDHFEHFTVGPAYGHLWYIFSCCVHKRGGKEDEHQVLA